MPDILWRTSDMLKKIKKKFLISAIVTITIVITVIVGAINTFNIYSIIDNIDTTLANTIGESDKTQSKLEKIPGYTLFFPAGSNYSNEYFKVTFKSGENPKVNLYNSSSMSESGAIELARSLVNSKQKTGFTKSLKYRYMISAKGSTVTVGILDCSKALVNARSMFLSSVLISIFGIAVVSIILTITAENIVRPISEGYEKQKRFITDAGHDIKTPLTVINADAELLEMEIGDNEWLADIKKQTARLTTLTGDLIYLSRMEEHQKTPHADFPLSEVAEEVVASFSAPAITKRITLNSYIMPALYYHGHAESIRKLLTLLIDNAIKYSPEGGIVDVSINKQGRTITIRVSNQAPGLGVKAVEHMFDRFYRSDSSRSSNGGFGIGLSVAKAIVSSHKGRIYAHKQRDVLTIDVILF